MAVAISLGMPSTSKFLISPTNPYQITGRCLNKEWFAIPLPIVWEILGDYLHFVSRAYHLKIHMFLLMGNHFHLMASSPNALLSEAMQYFMAQTSRTFAREAGRINHIWGSRFYRCEITSHHYYLNAYKYNYRNPVAAGLVRSVEDYPFSTLYGLLGRAHSTIPVEEDVTLFSDVEGTLEWLNTSPTDANSRAIQKALRRKSFALPKINSKSHPLEFDLL